MLGMTWGDISPWIFYDMGLPLLLVAAAAYLLGCSNGAVIVSKYILRDDVRTHGSGNAGLTNFYRTFGGPLTLVVILCDVLKAVAAVWAGILMARYWDGGFWSQEAIVLVFAKYWAGLFCLLGLLLGGLVVYMHRGNIHRLLTGTENKFSLHKKQ